MQTFLQYGSHQSGCFKTELVEYKESLLPHHELGFSYTSTGYGSKLPTRYMVRVDNGLSWRWYRVYSVCHSNVSSEYVVIRGERVRVQFYDE